MSMPWVKLHWSVLDSDVFRRLSPDGKGTFVICLAIAGKCRQKGALALRVGPMTVKEIAGYVGHSPRKQRAVLDELVQADMLGVALDGSYFVQRFSQFQERPAPSEPAEPVLETADVSAQNDDGSRETLRDKSREGSFFSNSLIEKKRDSALERNDALEAEVDIQRDVPPVGSPGCVCGKMGTDESWTPETAVTAFLAVFANARSQLAKNRAGPRWLATLREMRSKGATWPAIWSAFATAHADGGHAPIGGFGAVWPNLRAERSRFTGGNRVTSLHRRFGYERPARTADHPGVPMRGAV